MSVHFPYDIQPCSFHNADTCKNGLTTFSTIVSKPVLGTKVQLLLKEGGFGMTAMIVRDTAANSSDKFGSARDSNIRSGNKMLHLAIFLPLSVDTTYLELRLRPDQKQIVASRPRPCRPSFVLASQLMTQPLQLPVADRARRKATPSLDHCAGMPDAWRLQRSAQQVPSRVTFCTLV